MTGSTAFQQKFGFRRDEVTLANWRTPGCSADQG
jgi:hypothetical protein